MKDRNLLKNSKIKKSLSFLLVVLCLMQYVEPNVILADTEEPLISTIVEDKEVTEPSDISLEKEKEVKSSGQEKSVSHSVENNLEDGMESQQKAEIAGEDVDKKHTMLSNPVKETENILSEETAEGANGENIVSPFEEEGNISDFPFDAEMEYSFVRNSENEITDIVWTYKSNLFAVNGAIWKNHFVMTCLSGLSDMRVEDENGICIVSEDEKPHEEAEVSEETFPLISEETELVREQTSYVQFVTHEIEQGERHDYQYTITTPVKKQQNFYSVAVYTELQEKDGVTKGILRRYSIKTDEQNSIFDGSESVDETDNGTTVGEYENEGKEIRWLAVKMNTTEEPQNLEINLSVDSSQTEKGAIVLYCYQPTEKGYEEYILSDTQVEIRDNQVYLYALKPGSIVVAELKTEITDSSVPHFAGEAQLLPFNKAGIYTWELITDFSVIRKEVLKRVNSGELFISEGNVRIEEKILAHLHTETLTETVREALDMVEQKNEESTDKVYNLETLRISSKPLMNLKNDFLKTEELILEVMEGSREALDELPPEDRLFVQYQYPDGSMSDIIGYVDLMKDDAVTIDKSGEEEYIWVLKNTDIDKVLVYNLRAPITVKIKVEASENSSIPIDGAKFRIKSGAKYYTGTTDIDGVATIENIPLLGGMTLLQLTGKEGYTPSSEEIVLDASTIQDGILEVTVKNPKEKGKFIVKKVDQDGEILPGADFQLSGSNLLSPIEKRSDQTGRIVFEHLETGTYTLRETSAPQGYSADLDKTWTVTVGENAATTITENRSGPVGMKAYALKTENIVRDLRNVNLMNMDFSLRNVPEGEALISNGTNPRKISGLKLTHKISTTATQGYYKVDVFVEDDETISGDALYNKPQSDYVVVLEDTANLYGTEQMYKDRLYDFIDYLESTQPNARISVVTSHYRKESAEMKFNFLSLSNARARIQNYTKGDFIRRTGSTNTSRDFNNGLTIARDLLNTSVADKKAVIQIISTGIGPREQGFITNPSDSDSVNDNLIYFRDNGIEFHLICEYQKSGLHNWAHPYDYYSPFTNNIHLLFLHKNNMSADGYTTRLNNAFQNAAKGNIHSTAKLEIKLKDNVIFDKLEHNDAAHHSDTVTFDPAAKTVTAANISLQKGESLSFSYYVKSDTSKRPYNVLEDIAVTQTYMPSVQNGIICEFPKPKVMTPAIDIKVKKEWGSNIVQDLRQDTTVILQANGSPIDTKADFGKTIQLCDFGLVPQFDNNGEDISYTVSEQGLDPALFVSEISYHQKTDSEDTQYTQPAESAIMGTKDGLVKIKTYYRKLNLTVVKNWNNTSPEQKKTVTVKLKAYHGDTEVSLPSDVESEKILNAEGDWKATFLNLPMAAADGRLYEYRVVEIGVEGMELEDYDIRYIYTNNEYQEIINKKIPEITVINTKKTGSIQFAKQKEGSNIPIQGAKFKLNKDGESVFENGTVKIYTTDIYGRLNFEALEDGDYKLYETEAAEGYILPDPNVAVAEFEVQYGEITGTSVNPTNKIIYNTPLGIDLNIAKFERGSSSEKPLRGAVFELYKVTDTSTNPVTIQKQILGETSSWMTGINGTVTIPDLREGTYWLKEIKSPDGYTVVESHITPSGYSEVYDSWIGPITVADRVISFEQDVNAKMEDGRLKVYDKKVAITFYKIDGDDYITELNGAEFEIHEMKADGTTNRIITTIDGNLIVSKKMKIDGIEADGTIHLEGAELTQGSYELWETKPPEGYERPNAAVAKFTIDKETGKVQVTELNGEPFSGSEPDGGYEITNVKLPPMKFRLRKLDENGNYISLDKLTVKFSKLKQAEHPLVMNKMNLGDGYNTIVDDGFPPVSFELDMKDNKQETFGQFITIPLDWPTGNYILEEMKAPAGYIKAHRKYYIYIDQEDREILLDVVDNGVRDIVTGEFDFATQDGLRDADQLLFKDEKWVWNNPNNGNQEEQLGLYMVNMKGRYPSAGGRGDIWFLLFGTALMMIAGLKFVKRRRRVAEERNS